MAWMGSRWRGFGPLGLTASPFTLESCTNINIFWVCSDVKMVRRHQVRCKKNSWKERDCLVQKWLLMYFLILYKVERPHKQEATTCPSSPTLGLPSARRRWGHRRTAEKAARFRPLGRVALTGAPGHRSQLLKQRGRPQQRDCPTLV